MADVQSLLNANGISCHAGPGAPRGLDLTSVAVVVGASAVECSMKKRIAPGDSQHSYLVDKIIGSAQDGGCFAGARTPAGGPYLVPSDIAAA